VSAGICLLIISGCLLIQSFFAASEMSLVSANRLRIRHRADSGSRRARLVQGFLEVPEKFLSTTLVGINFLLVLGSTIASYFASQVLGFGNHGPLVATVVMLPLVLIFAEIVPKTLVQPRATRVSMVLILPLQLAFYLFYPLVQVLSWISGGFLRVFGVSSRGKKMFASLEEIRLLMKEGEKQGALTEEEQKMIARVFDFGENEVSDIMVPLIDVAVVEENSRVADVWRIIKETGYTRIPVYRDRVDKIIGTVQATDLVMEEGEGNIRSHLRRPYIVPESKPLEELLEELRNNDVNMAIVVDEYGGVAGIVTLENIVEEIVGKIQDEYDVEEVSEFRLKGDVAEVSGRMRIDELNEVLNLNLPEEETETIAGFLIDLIGKIPAVGEKISYHGHLYSVTQVTDRRVVKLEIRGPAVKKKAGSVKREG
jgi:putative hemolysin